MIEPDSLPTCDHRDHDTDVPAVAQYEGTKPRGGHSFRFWACAEHEPEDVPALKRIDPGQSNRTVVDTEKSEEASNK